MYIHVIHNMCCYGDVGQTNHMCIHSGLGIVPRVDLNTYCPYMSDISDMSDITHVTRWKDARISA